MAFYNYFETLIQDIKEFIEREGLIVNDETKDEIYNMMWNEDCITGNGSGSYFFNKEQAREALRGNEERFWECADEFEYPLENFVKDPEGADVCIRCCLLGAAFDKVVEEIETRKD